MNRRYIFAAALLLAFFANPFPGFAKFPGILSRLEVSFSYVGATGTFNGTTGYYNYYTGHFIGDTTVKRNISAKAGYGESISTYFPLSRMGRKSVLALSVGLQANEFVWGSLNKVYASNGGNGYEGRPELTGATVQYAVPIGFDFKFGCDALQTKNIRFCGSFGGGVLPSMNATTLSAGDNGGAGFNFGVNPYLRAEVGIRAAICMKIRAMVAFGSVPYIDEKKDIASATDGPFKLTGQTEAVISFVIMPFSFKWEKEGWWYTY